MSGDTLKVYYVFGDPVDNPKLRQDGAMDGLKYGQVYNPIVGYYGENRIDSDGNPKKHSGFDYLAPEGTEVKAVHAGTITKVRIGRLTKVPCANRDWLASKFKEGKICEDCEYNSQCGKIQSCRKRCCQCQYRGACYGIQLWLQWSKKAPRYAFYAHLSRLNVSIWNEIKDKIKTDVSDYNLNLSVSKGDILGYAGCTGNASNMKPYQEHLHFEFRKDSEDRAKYHPNYIVGTKFILQKGIYEMIEDRKKIDKLNKLYANKVIDKTVRDEVFRHIDGKIDTFITKVELKKQ